MRRGGIFVSLRILCLQDIIGYTVIPVDIGTPIDGQLLIVRQNFAPWLFVTVNGPVVPVETPPENSTAVFVQKLLADHTRIIRFQIHDTDRIQ